MPAYLVDVRYSFVYTLLRLVQLSKRELSLPDHLFKISIQLGSKVLNPQIFDDGGAIAFLDYYSTTKQLNADMSY